MSKKVIGAGFIFLASGCGPVLSEEQREYIKTVKPNEYYPQEKLLEILYKAEKEQSSLVLATGRRWGSAIKGELVKKGISNPLESLKILCGIYQDHHQGEVGELTIEVENATTVYLTNGSPYPSIMISSTYAALASAQGAEDVKVEETDTANKFKISWESAEE
jgi:hypothetical protein